MGNFRSFIICANRNVRKIVYRKLDKVSQVFLWESLRYNTGDENVSKALELVCIDKRRRSSAYMWILIDIAVKYRLKESLKFTISSFRGTREGIMDLAIKYGDAETLGNILDSYAKFDKTKAFQLIEIAAHSNQLKCLQVLCDNRKKYKSYVGDRQEDYYDILYSLTYKIKLSEIRHSLHIALRK